MIAPSGEQIQLKAHGQELVVVEVGGGIRTYSTGGVEVIDGYADDEICEGGRGQLLAPWPNRLEDGRYEWAGRQLQAALTEPANHNAIHGLVRWVAWRVAEATDDRARLEYRLHPQPGWPWTVDMAVEYQLTDDGLKVRTIIDNPGDAPCPLGVGWHPYLKGPVDEMVLTVPASVGHVTDPRGLPLRTFAVEGTRFDYRKGAPIAEAVLDTPYTGLERDGDGKAEVEVLIDGRRVRLWMDEHFTHVMVYTGDTLASEDRRRQGLAIEPMTCAPNMLRTGDGLNILKPGAQFEAEWGLQSFRIS